MKNNSMLAFVAALLLVGITLVYIYKQSKYNEVAQQPPVTPQNPWWNPVPQEPQKELTYEDALNSITEVELKKDLYYLASQELEGRMSGKKGNVVAAEFIKKKYEAFGLKTEYQKFNIQRMNEGPNREQGDSFTQNIIAWIEGSELPNEVIVVGAHMDHIGYGPSMSRSRKIAVHPGADDNASGTVALMEIAQAISMLKPKRTIVFIAFSAEEMGLIGSRYYCEHPLFPKSSPDIRKHIFMLNMDMVGYLGKGRFYAFWGEGNSSFDLDNYIKELNGKYSFARSITSRGSGGSDHASFYNKKIPIAFLHTGLHDYYHTPEDTADKINYNGIEKIAKYAFELIWKVSESSSAPQFNLAEFREMPYTHDHGHPEMPFYHHYHDHEHGHTHK